MEILKIHGHTKVTDDQIRFIVIQFDTIDNQIKILQNSKDSILEQFRISASQYYLRKGKLFNKN